MQTTRQCGTKTFVRCQKKRLACCVLDDGTCADLLSSVAVAVRSLVVLDENVTASPPPSFNWQPRQTRQMVSFKRIKQAYLHPSPVLRYKVNRMHSCYSTLSRKCASLRLVAMHPTINRYHCALKHLSWPHVLNAACTRIPLRIRSLQLACFVTSRTSLLAWCEEPQRPSRLLISSCTL